MNKLLPAIATALGLALAAPVAAITTFASFIPTSSFPNIFFTGTTSAGVLSSAAAPVTFRFLDPNGVSLADFAATLNFTAATGSAIAAGGIGIVPVTTGTISFTSAAPVTYNGVTGTNLLTATFSGGALTALIGGSTASYANSFPPNAVTFTSSFLDFTATTARDLSLAINAINPSITASSTTGVADFAGTASGNFGADLAAGSPAGIPEPATWGMMVIGFGLIGVSRRRYIRSVTA